MTYHTALLAMLADARAGRRRNEPWRNLRAMHFKTGSDADALSELQALCRLHGVRARRVDGAKLGKVQGESFVVFTPLRGSFG